MGGVQRFFSDGRGKRTIFQGVSRDHLWAVNERLLLNLLIRGRNEGRAITAKEERPGYSLLEGFWPTRGRPT